MCLGDCHSASHKGVDQIEEWLIAAAFLNGASIAAWMSFLLRRSLRDATGNAHLGV